MAALLQELCERCYMVCAIYLHSRVWVTDLQLGSRQIDISHHFSAGVLHLQAGVEFQEVEAAILAVEVLHCTRTDIPNHFSQFYSTLREKKDNSIHIIVQSPTSTDLNLPSWSKSISYIYQYKQSQLGCTLSISSKTSDVAIVAGASSIIF